MLLIRAFLKPMFNDTGQITLDTEAVAVARGGVLLEKHVIPTQAFVNVPRFLPPQCRGRGQRVGPAVGARYPDSTPRRLTTPSTAVQGSRGRQPCSTHLAYSAHSCVCF
jgi:hypothetical protein